MVRISSAIRHCCTFALLPILGLLVSSGAALAQPTLSKVFTPNTIGPGSVSTITFTITNGSVSPATDLAFTDTLPVAPGPVTIADPASASTTCDLGLTGTLSAPAGGPTIMLSGAQIGGFQACTVTVNVTAGTPGVHTNPAITLTSSVGGSASLPVDLTVATNRPGFAKSFAPGSVPLGNRSALTFTVDNGLNPSLALLLTFTDSLPVGLVIADPLNVADTCNAFSTGVVNAAPGGGVLSYSGGSVGAGSICTVTVDVVTTGVGTLKNVTGEMTSLVGFTTQSSGKASATLEVTATPLALRKSFTDDPAPPGGTVTLEFSIDNFNRLDSATGISFTDDLTTLAPALAGLTFSSLISNDCGGSVSGVGGTTISFSGGTVAPEGSCTIQVGLAVPAGATPGVYTNTTGTITGTVGGSPVVGNMASDDLFVESVPVLTKEFLEVGTLAADPVINAGDDVVLRFTITNPSATSMATAIAFLDELTDGSGGSPPDTTSGFLPFPVTVTLPPVPDPPCGAGSSLTLIGLGGDRQGLSLTGGSLAAAPGPGDSCTFEVTVSIPSTLPPGNYLNTTEQPTATIDGATRTGKPASDTLTVIGAPALTKAFTDDPVGPGGTVTLEFTLTSPPDATVDATGISFTDDLAPVLAGLTANLPVSPDPPCGVGSSLTGSAGDTLLTLTGGTLSPGGSCTFSVTLNVPAAAAAGSYTNTTSGVGATVGGLPATSDPASDNLQVAGLVFTKQFLTNPVIPGATTTLRFTIDNIHPTDDATITVFTDSLNAALTGLAATGGPSSDTCGGTLGGTTFLTYSGGSVSSGTSCTIEVPVLVPLGAADGTYLNVTSSLVATQGSAVVIDPATDTLTVNSNLLQLTKAFTDDPVAPGGSVTLEFTLTNLDAAQSATGVGFDDDLGAALAGLTFDSVLLDTCGGTVVTTGTTMITVSGVGLAAGASCTLRVSLTVPAAAAAGVYPNTTSAVSGTLGGFLVAGDAASDDLVVTQLLLFSKAFDGPTTAAGTATLTFTITNPGPATAAGIGFSDDLDAVISGLIATSLPAVPCGAGSSITGISSLTFSGGTLPPAGGVCSFDVQVLVPASATAGTFPNTTSRLFRSGLPVADPATAGLTIEPPPTFAKAFGPGSIAAGAVTTLTFTIDNSASALAATGLDFTDNLPAGVVVAATPAASTTCTGGTLTATSGSGTLGYSGGSVGPGASCTVQVDVRALASGALVNTTGDLTSSSGNSGTATDTVTVTAPPAPPFAKVFAPDAIGAGAVSTLTFTIDNTGSLLDATGLDFIDNLPPGMVVATPSNATTTCTGGTLTANSGTAVISYTGGTVAAASSCTVSADVTSAAGAAYANITGNLTSSLGSSGNASATLSVNPPGVPPFSKAFAPNSIAAGAVTTLTFTIDNTANLVPATGLDFTDVLPAGAVVAAAPNASTTCTGGTLTAVAGTDTISYSGGTVPASSSCTLQVDVSSDVGGTFDNISGNLNSSAGTSLPATATLTVSPPPLPGFSKDFAPAAISAGAPSTLTFTIDNTASLVAASGLDFTDNFPPGLVVGTPANASTTCTGGTLTAVEGSGSVSYTGGTVPAGAICLVQVDVTSTTTGTIVNVTGPLSSSAGSSAAASAGLTVSSVPHEIPTLDTLGLLLLALALGLLAWSRLRAS